jgi:hypothetical protein
VLLSAAGVVFLLQLRAPTSVLDSDRVCQCNQAHVRWCPLLANYGSRAAERAPPHPLQLVDKPAGCI